MGQYMRETSHFLLIHIESNFKYIRIYKIYNIPNRPD